MKCIHLTYTEKEYSSSSGPKGCSTSSSSPSITNAKCRLASTLAGKEVPTSPDACKACIATERPMGLNSVTTALAFAVTRDKELLELCRQLSITTFNKPGTCLRNILKRIGISEGEACQCNEYAAKMDCWGSDGCTARIPEIVAHLNSQTVSWFDTLKVALAGYLTTESLVNEAISCSKKPTTIPVTVQAQYIKEQSDRSKEHSLYLSRLEMIDSTPSSDKLDH